MIEIGFNDMNEAVGGMLAGFDKKDDKEIEKCMEEYSKNERVVRLGMQMMLDGKLQEWDWQYAESRGWLCEKDFEWFKAELDAEGILPRS